MAKKHGYVAGVINTLEAMEALIGQSPEVVAEVFLRDTIEKQPKPAWETGALRRSGMAYIGSVPYINTVGLLGPMHRDLQDNPNFYARESMTFTGATDRPESYDSFSVLRGPRHIKGAESLTFKDVKRSGRGGLNRFAAARKKFTLRDKVTVAYSAPYAATMHEWTGNFSHHESGPGFITTKAPYLAAGVAKAMKGVG